MVIDNDNSNNDQEKEDDIVPIVVVDGKTENEQQQQQQQQDEHPEEGVVATTTTTITEKESAAPAEQGNDGGNAEPEQTNEKCTIAVFPTEILGRPPPDYSLTSPCLPPNSPREQDWPPEPPPPFDGHPPYPAGPPLLKVAYPKDIPGPTYACPKCEGRFLYHRRAGIVQCPFCHSEISIGRYARNRAWLWLLLSLLALSNSLIFVNRAVLFPGCALFFVTAGCLMLCAVLLLYRAIHMFHYRETERIEFT